MMKKWWSLILAVVLCWTLAGAALADGTSGGLTVSVPTTLWTSKAVNAGAVTVIPAGGTLMVTAYDMEWRWLCGTYTAPDGQTYTGWIENATANVAVVICQRLTLRAEANNRSTSLGRVEHGDVLVILDASNPEWYLVETTLKGTLVQGYIHAPYVIENPKYYDCAGTVLYAWGGREAKRVGQVTGSYLVIGETDYYYIISYMGGSAFIRK